MCTYAWKYIDSNAQWRGHNFKVGRAQPEPLTALIEYFNVV